MLQIILVLAVACVAAFFIASSKKSKDSSVSESDSVVVEPQVSEPVPAKVEAPKAVKKEAAPKKKAATKKSAKNAK